MTQRGFSIFMFMMVVSAITLDPEVIGSMITVCLIYVLLYERL